MYNPSREQVRQFFFDAWRKHRERLPLVGLDAVAVDVMLLHSEYHHVLDDPARHLERDYAPDTMAYLECLRRK